MEDLLREMIDELKALNQNVEAIADRMPLVSPIHNTDDIHTKIEDVGDAITGGILGTGGSNLSDVADGISSLETVIDLK